MNESGQAGVAAGAEVPTAEVMLEMVILKEDEIEKRVRRARSEAERLIEDAKLDAAAIKREAQTVVVGENLREEALDKARAEAEKAEAELAAQADEVRRKGAEQIEKAVSIVMDGVLPPIQGRSSV